MVAALVRPWMAVSRMAARTWPAWGSEVDGNLKGELAGAIAAYESATAARMLAVETLLADPEALDDDVLESCL
jgi:hypothetical protein